MNCKFRETLRKGTGETARMFSICKQPDLLKAFNAEWVKVRNPLVCEDCPHRLSISHMGNPGSGYEGHYITEER